MIYQNKQVASLILACLGITAVLMVSMLVFNSYESWEAEAILSTVLFVLVLTGFLFSNLTTSVTREELAMAFGPGWIRKKIPIRDILSAKPVRNPWYYGWGIRWTPHGWMYNVSGLDAVQLELSGKRKFRVGTNDPKGLVNAIEEARGANG